MTESTPHASLFDALKEGQENDLALILDEARNLFEKRSLADRYARLLNVHFALNPHAPQEKVDRDLTKIAQSNEMQAKYDVLYAVLTEQAQNILDCAAFDPDDLEIGNATISVANLMLTKTNNDLNSTDRADAFESASRTAAQQGVLFIPPTQRPQ